jgi:hypothetical protein
MSIQDAIAAELGEHPSDAPKARRAKSIPKAQPKATNAITKRGFTIVKASKNKLAEAKSVMVKYLTGVTNGRYPGVGFNPQDKSKPWNRPIMFAVALVWGFTNDADGSAKVATIQQAYGLTPSDRKLGLPAMASSSAIVREKTMGAPSVDWIARPNARGVFFLLPTRPAERMAARAIRGQGKLTGDRPKAKPAKATPDQRASRSNGAVTVTVDKALRSTAKMAERNTQRAANRAKVAAEKAAAN